MPPRKKPKAAQRAFFGSIHIPPFGHFVECTFCTFGPRSAVVPAQTHSPGGMIHQGWADIKLYSDVQNN
ncbi:hypothetical protein SE17_16825 [Kouleothrix aurantiaca]|uniref:Uncharacterized protein n=1 Tax=Kouleothrix aurantiaca TaxID=186479 RepID=A0A0P9FGH5_9CHLR|nr:hypothetical protein SE17_16825 [Kouleothrix aurantiaca]